MKDEQILGLKETDEIYILPSKTDNGENFYAEDSIDFFKFAKEHNVDIQFEDDSRKFWVMHDDTIIIPLLSFALKMLPTVIDLVIKFIKNKVGRNKEGKTCEFEAKVTTKKGVKEIKYKGPIEGFEKMDFNDMLK